MHVEGVKFEVKGVEVKVEGVQFEVKGSRCSLRLRSGGGEG